MQDIIKKTIHEMPDNFTSNEFNRQAIKNGITRREIRQKNGLGDFIKKYANNSKEYPKRWSKKGVLDNYFFGKPLLSQSLDYQDLSVIERVYDVLLVNYKHFQDENLMMDLITLKDKIKTILD